MRCRPDPSSYLRTPSIPCINTHAHRFHRQAIMARFQDPAGELAHVAEALEEDAKNYHVWAYRSVQSVSQSVSRV